MASATVALLRTRVANNQYDVEAWDLLVDELARDVLPLPPNMRNPAHVQQLMTTLQSVVGLFPTASKHWKLYADLEMDRNNLEGAKNIFSKCLLTCLNVDLWSSYLRYIKFTNQHKGDHGQVEIQRAFEFSLDKLGTDSAAGELWAEYIAFMSAPAINTPRFMLLFQATPGQEFSARAAKLRTLFQRALVVPSAKLDTLWGEYERFEQSLVPRGNTASSARFIEDMRPRFNNARTAWTVRRRFLERLDLTALPALPGKSPREGQFEGQRALWLEFLAYEMRNEQGLDAKSQRARVDLSYQQALYVLRNCPEVWYQWAMLWMDNGGEGFKHAVTVLQQARAAIPSCVMLSFALADLEEGSGQVERARGIYEEMVKRMEGEESDPENGFSAEAGSAVWVQYMRFAKRNGRGGAAGGQTDARRVFMRARKWDNCTWHVFVCHALMEWHLQRQLQPEHFTQSVTIVKRIFELGLSKPGVLASPGYLETFANWLVNTTGDVENARVHFEGALAEESAQANPEMWDAFLRFEHSHGTLQEVLALEGRRATALADRRVPLPPHDDFQRMLCRSTAHDLWGCTLEQRRYLETVLAPPSARASTGRPDDIAPSDSNLPASVSVFLTRLPPGLEPDQPIPDVDYVISIIMHANLDGIPDSQSNGLDAAVGAKRSATAANLGSQPPSPAYTDVYRQRQKQRIEGS